MPPMNIAELIRREGVKRFAEAVGISRPYALQLRDGVYFPSFALLARIRRVFPELDVNATLDAATRLGGRG